MERFHFVLTMSKFSETPPNGSHTEFYQHYPVPNTDFSQKEKFSVKNLVTVFMKFLCSVLTERYKVKKLHPLGNYHCPGLPKYQHNPTVTIIFDKSTISIFLGNYANSSHDCNGKFANIIVNSTTYSH